MKQTDNKKKAPDARCTYCGQPLMVIWVHGHGQCHFCKTNIDECCRGESCESNNKIKPN